MAAAQSHYSSTQETTNANRVYRILLGPCTDQLRDVLCKKIPPSTFAVVIDKYRYKLNLTPMQRDLILPQIWSYNGKYDDFDISLLYILLRNICQIPAHKNGWGKDPDVNDSSLSASIERIRVTRNNTIHSGKSYLTNTEFGDIWTSLKSAVVSMDAYLLNQNYYEKEIQNLRITTMDPVQDKHYRDQLAKLYAADQDTKECVRLLQESQKRMEKKMEEYSQQQRKFKTELKENLRMRIATSIPENIKDQHKRILHSWKTDVFFETSSFKELQAFFISRQIVAVIGSPGSGKTALIRHIALALESKYQIVPIIKPDDIITFGDLHKEQIFVIDDVLGVFTLEREALSFLERQRKRIENVLDTKTKRSKLFMSCRLAVYNEAKKLHVDFFEDDNILNLESEENNLTMDDRKSMLEAHLKNAGISCKIDQKILQRKEVLMFPLLCQMFSSDKSIRSYGTEFFTCPSRCLLSEIGIIEQRNNFQYLSMVLCMLNNNCLSKEIFRNTRMLDRVFRSCKVKGIPQEWEIFEHLSHLKGTYVSESDKKYTFIHESVFEVVAYHYGRKFPDQILDYMSSHFIANKVVLKTKETREGLCIKVQKSQYQNLARRLYIDVKKGKLHDVFLNAVLKDFAFKQQFKNILSESPFEDVKKSFFLTRKEGNDSVMLGSRKEADKEEAEEALEQRELDRQVLLLGLKCFGPHDIYEIRAISFIIYYGHFDLLKYLINLVVKNSQSIDLILGSSEEEQARLLVLACYNGNLDMVKFLIEKIGKRFINKMPVGEVDIMCNRHCYVLNDLN